MSVFSSRGTGRRLLAAASTVAALAVATACTSSGGGGGGGGSGGAPAVPTPVSSFGAPGGAVDEIRWNLPYGEPNTVDPPNTAYYSSALVAMNLCEPLLRFGNDYSISPGLATLEQPDPMTMVLTLTDGVTFWDGSPMTADDVVWSLDHARDPATITSFLFSNVTSVSATARNQVTIRLSAPDSMLVTELATFAGAVQQKAFAQKAGRNLGSTGTGVMCTGPFTLGSWQAGQSMTLLRNERYWDASRAAKAAKVTLSFTTDSTSMAQALVSGQLDGAYEVPAATIPKLRAAAGGSLVFGGPTQLYLTLLATRTTGPLADADVRKALFMTIDRAALAKAVYQGAATPNYTAVNRDAWDNAATPAAAREAWRSAYGGFEQERAPWGGAAAVTEAGKLATSAGYSGEPIVLATLAGDATLSQVAQLVQATAKQAGLNVQIKAMQPLDYSNASVDPKKREGTDLMLGVSFNGAPTALEPIQFLFLPDNFYNYTGYSDPTVTAAITAARTSGDPLVQARELIRAQAVYEQAHTGATLLQIQEIVFVSKRLSGLTTSFSYLNQASLATIGATG